MIRGNGELFETSDGQGLDPHYQPRQTTNAYIPVGSTLSQYSVLTMKTLSVLPYMGEVLSSHRSDPSPMSLIIDNHQICKFMAHGKENGG